MRAARMKGKEGEKAKEREREREKWEKNIKEKREKKGRKKGKERRKKKKRKKKKRRGRKPNQRRAVVGPGNARNGTMLREVGVFLPQFYSTPSGCVMAYMFRSDSRQICLMCLIMGRLGTEYMSSHDHRGRA